MKKIKKKAKQIFINYLKIYWNQKIKNKIFLKINN